MTRFWNELKLNKIVDAFRKNDVKSIRLDMYLESFIESNKEFYRPSTINSYRVTLNHLREFRPQALIEDVDYNFLKKFQTYLRSKGNSESGMFNKFKHLKKILTEARSDGCYSGEPFRDFKMPKCKNRTVFLEGNELTALENLSSKTPWVNNVRLMFLFMCYTGLRFSDMQNLKIKNIRSDYTMQGRVLDFNQVKDS